MAEGDVLRANTGDELAEADDVIRCGSGCLGFLFFELLLNSRPRIQTGLETIQLILINILRSRR